MTYQDDNRGIIQYPKKMQQVISFEGMRYGNITPTDIDGCIERRDLDAVILYEFKYGDAPIPYGQKRALEVLIESLDKNGKTAIIFKCSHNIQDPDEIIIAAKTLAVEQYTQDGGWRKIEYEVTCEEITRRFWEFAQERKMEMLWQ